MDGAGDAVGAAFGVDVLLWPLLASGFVWVAAGGAGNCGFGRVNAPFWPQPTKMRVIKPAATVGAKKALNGFCLTGGSNLLEISKV